MAFLLYFVVLVVCAGTVLFGLDWMNSPLPEVQKPPVHVAKVESKAKPVRHIDASPAVADPKSQLSPIHPAQPGGALADKAAKNDDAQPKANAAPKADMTVAANSNQKPDNGNTRAETSGAAATAASLPKPAAPAPAAQVNNERVANMPPAATQPKADTQTNQQTNAAPARCDVSACAAAYHSFRASDCSYQPFSGPRRACTNPAGGNIADRGNVPAQPRNEATVGPQQRDDADLDNATRGVRRLTARDRNRTRYEDDDDGDRVIVRRSVRPAPFPFDFFHPGDDD